MNWPLPISAASVYSQILITYSPDSLPQMQRLSLPFKAPSAANDPLYLFTWMAPFSHLYFPTYVIWVPLSSTITFRLQWTVFFSLIFIYLCIYFLRHRDWDKQKDLPFTGLLHKCSHNNLSLGRTEPGVPNSEALQSVPAASRHDAPAWCWSHWQDGAHTQVLGNGLCAVQAFS